MEHEKVIPGAFSSILWEQAATKVMSENIEIHSFLLVSYEVGGMLSPWPFCSEPRTKLYWLSHFTHDDNNFMCCHINWKCTWKHFPLQSFSHNIVLKSTMCSALFYYYFNGLMLLRMNELWITYQCDSCAQYGTTRLLLKKKINVC